MKYNVTSRIKRLSLQIKSKTHRPASWRVRGSQVVVRVRSAHTAVTTVRIGHQVVEPVRCGHGSGAIHVGSYIKSSFYQVIPDS